MTQASGPSPFRFSVVRPDVPEPADWLPYLSESYDWRRFANFGPAATRFEAALTAQFGEADDAFVAASSATSALAACLIAEGVTGRVLVSAFTFPASASAIRMARAEPALIDVDPASWACDVASLERGLDHPGVAAVMLVAPFGITQDFSAHVALCAARGIPAVIDNAAGLGGGGRGRRALRGTAYEVYSLHATKPFAIGEGGAIQTPDNRVEALRAALNFGLPWSPERRGAHGINGKIPEISAAVGLAVLADYPDTLVARRSQARRYVELVGRFDGVATSGCLADAPWQVFPCLMPNARAADDFVEAAARRGLEARRYYRPSLSQWGGIELADDCPVAEDLAERMVCLPIYSRAAKAEIAELHGIVEASFETALAVSARRRIYVSAA
jgi:dTDP-4-amino-4,6-dideoxygalactose transaminase